MLAVVAALPFEVGGLLRRLGSSSRTPVADGWSATATVNGKEVLVCITGVGPRRAAAAIEALLARHSVNALLTVGLAGGLSPDLKPGMLALSTTMSAWEWRNEAGFVESGQALACDAGLVERARTLLKDKGVPFITGRTACSPVLVVRSADKRAMFRGSGAQAVDMEAFWVLQAARERAVPCLNVRAVMDAASHNLPRSFLRIADNSGKLSPVDVASFTLRPWEWPTLCQTARRRRKALRSLDTFLQHWLSA